MNARHTFSLSKPCEEGFVIWLTGLPASGKSSLARALNKMMARQGLTVVVIDSDDMRAVLTPKPTYDPAERDRFYQTLGCLAVWLARSGINVIVAATAHRRKYRDDVRIQVRRFVEIFVDCPLDECRVRDPKGIYAQASENINNQVPGVGVEFEAPLNPEIVIDSGRLFPKQGAWKIIDQLRRLQLIKSPSADIPISQSSSAAFATAKK